MHFPTQANQIKKTEYLIYVLLLYTWEQFTQPARYPTASEGTAGRTQGIERS